MTPTDTTTCSGGGTNNGNNVNGDDNNDGDNIAQTNSTNTQGEVRQVQRRSLSDTLLNWETPAAYRTRLRVAIVLILVAVIARILNGGRLRLDQIFSNVMYSSQLGDEQGNSFGFTVVYGPNLGFLLLSLLVRFMLHRPPPPQQNINDEIPPPRPEAQVVHEHNE